MKLRRFWITFDKGQVPVGARLGCGVTAKNETAALALIKRQMFGNEALPVVKAVRPDISLEEVDQSHVRPNMGNAAIEGIWFPLGYANGEINKR